MNPIKENRKIESSPSRVACVEPWPIATIRTETVLSRLPIHNLAKKGNINIQIVKRNAEGAITLHWEVSHSDRYGQPRQIAYKLDTLVINPALMSRGGPSQNSSALVVSGRSRQNLALLETRIRFAARCGRMPSQRSPQNCRTAQRTVANGRWKPTSPVTASSSPAKNCRTDGAPMRFTSH